MRVKKGLIALALALSACQAPLTPIGHLRPKTSGGPGPIRPTIAPASPSTLGGSTSVGTLPPITGPALSGVVRVDPDYLRSIGAGNIIAVGSGSLIGKAGGNIIAVGSGSLIGKAGGNVIAVGSGSYRTLDAALAPDSLTPASGMAVVAVSLTTQAPISAPVLTDSSGAYSLNIPTSQQGNVRIVAKIPTATADDPLQSDPRAEYDLVVPADVATGGAVVDEDTAIATQYLRETFAERINSVIDPSVSASDASAAISTWAPSGAGAIYGVILGGVSDTLMSWKGLVSCNPAINSSNSFDVAQRITDLMLAKVDLAQMMTTPQLPILTFDSPQDPNGWAGYAPQPEPVMAAMVDLLRRTRHHVTAMMPDGDASDAAMVNFETAVDAIARTTGLTVPPLAGSVSRPADVGQYIVSKFLGLSSPGTLDDVFYLLDMRYLSQSVPNTYLSGATLASWEQDPYTSWGDAKGKSSPGSEADPYPDSFVPGFQPVLTDPSASNPEINEERRLGLVAFSLLGAFALPGNGNSSLIQEVGSEAQSLILSYGQSSPTPAASVSPSEVPTCPATGSSSPS